MTPAIPFPSVCIPSIPAAGGMMWPNELGLLVWAASTFQNPRIIEFGTNWGHTTDALARIRGSSVITVDIRHCDRLHMDPAQRSESLLDHQIGTFAKHHNVTQVLVGDGSALPGGNDVAFIDGDHTYEGVRRDTEFVMETSHGRPVLLCWHDYYQDRDSWVGVSRYVDQLAAAGVQARFITGTRMAFGLFNGDSCPHQALMNAFGFRPFSSPPFRDLEMLPVLPEARVAAPV